jgi:hypothetical protein
LVRHLIANFAVISNIDFEVLEDKVSLLFLSLLFLFEWFLGSIGHLAEKIYIQALKVKQSVRILGKEHPDMIRAMSDLANNQGMLEKAVSMKKEVLEKRRRILREKHPHTVLAMRVLTVLNYMISQVQGENPNQSEFRIESLDAPLLFVPTASHSRPPFLAS